VTNLVPPTLGKTYHAFLFSDFVEQKNIKDKKRNTAFLLVCDKDSYKGKFFVLFSCMYLLQPQLVHLYYSSSLFLSAFP
jgi:hypothetical protein